MGEAVAQAGLDTIAIEKISESKSNPRRSMDKAALGELTESVKTHGVLQPVLVRPKGTGLELVSGHRRLAASKAAGLKEIPALVRELDDEEVLSVQLVENLQREDMHPLDEADGYSQLQKQFGWSADQIAAKVKKSRSYVYARVKLASLTPKSRKPFLADKVSASVALLIARIPNQKLAERAMAEISKGAWEGPFTHKEASRLIERKYMTDLGEAPFPTADAQLYPKAGSCSACPKRTGNQKELFADVSKGNICTDNECFATKAKLWLKQAVEDAKAAGLEVVEGKASNKIIDQYGGVKSGFVKLDARKYDAPRIQTWRKLLGKDCPPKIMVVRGDRIVEVVRSKDADAVIRGKYPWAKRRSSTSRLSAEQKREREKAKIDAVVQSVATERLIGKIEAAGTKESPETWRAVARLSIERGLTDVHRRIAKRRQLDPEKVGQCQKSYSTPILQAIDSCTAAQARALAFEIMVTDPWTDKRLRSACKLFGVRYEQIERTVRAKAKAAKNKPKKKATKKKPAARRATKKKASKRTKAKPRKTAKKR